MLFYSDLMFHAHFASLSSVIKGIRDQIMRNFWQFFITDWNVVMRDICTIYIIQIKVYFLLRNIYKNTHYMCVYTHTHARARTHTHARTHVRTFRFFFELSIWYFDSQWSNHDEFYLKIFKRLWINFYKVDQVKTNKKIAVTAFIKLKI